MLNFRTLKKDFSPAILKEGKELFSKDAVEAARIVNLEPQAIMLSCRVSGTFDNTYECEIEIDLGESMTVDSNCDCSYKYDCQHLAAVIFHLEESLDSIIVAYSKEADIEKSKEVDEEQKADLLEAIKEAENKEIERAGKMNEKELLEEYIGSGKILGRSPFFLPEESLKADKAELAIVFSDIVPENNKKLKGHEIQLALRLPFRSKPLNIPNIKEFLEAVRYREPMYIGNKRYFFTPESFDVTGAELLRMIMHFARFHDIKGERNQRAAHLGSEAFGTILAKAHELAMTEDGSRITMQGAGGNSRSMPCIYCSSLEEPLHFSNVPSMLRIELEYFEAPAPKILLKPVLVLGNSVVSILEDVSMFECSKPGVIHDNTYYRFQPQIKRKHLHNLLVLRDITIPEPLFGTFVENSIPELMRFSEVANRDILDRFVTLPFTGQLEAECDISYLNGELEAALHFVYDNVKVPAAASQLNSDDVTAFVSDEGILARNLTEEQKIIEDLFQGFVYEPVQGVYQAKTDKKVVEFMTEVIPRNQIRVKFNCPENLLDQFIYDETTFKMSLKETDRIDMYEVDLKVNGFLNGVTIDLLWECLGSKRSFIELSRKKEGKGKDGKGSTSKHKILVLDLEKLAPVVQIFDEIGINVLDDHKEERPLWSLASIDASQFKKLPIAFSMSRKLKHIQQQMLGTRAITQKPIPKSIKADLRGYQREGVNWLDRLRHMHLNGILADDMGLGKTLQAICAITQNIEENPSALSIIVCPTSLVYNWVEECAKFNPKLKVLPVDGTPAQRKKLIEQIKEYNILITSYSLLQKDIEHYQSVNFSYAILDEAQHIKNRGTRNAKSVKMIGASYKLILTGTPIENSLDELWSLFDFLMPGLLSSYDRFVEKYVRSPSQTKESNIDNLRAKVSPFILRRMKKDVLSELPPVSELVYHCHLSETQKELYRSYAKSAREELSQLVKKEGFDRVQIHVLATLTRLKQICCHPAIFAKETPEMGDSSKYDLLIELLETLIEGRHKTVIFSQYTRMLHIMRDDLQKRGIRFSYLDGSSKNRLGIVKEFNETLAIPVFLVSLKAGGSGLNLTGADTVIHYDMWWNPAVESQATDRVHRIGQKNSVSSLKLVTLGTIEEKIIELQDRKRGLVKKIVSCDEEAISKLTWEEVLELLQT